MSAASRSLPVYTDLDLALVPNVQLTLQTYSIVTVSLPSMVVTVYKLSASAIVYYMDILNLTISIVIMISVSLPILHFKKLLLNSESIWCLILKLMHCLKCVPIFKEDVCSVDKYVTGTMFTVSYTCTLGHTNIWRSQPSLRRMPSGNLLLSAAILLSGSSFSKIQQLLSILRMPFLSESEFYRIQRPILIRQLIVTGLYIKLPSYQFYREIA